MSKTVVGIDVGGRRKGFHAVALRGDLFLGKMAAADPAEIVTWCHDHKATVVAVDAPCGWSNTGSSRLAERELKVSGKQIYCFSTPTRQRAENHKKRFYDWVFNGEKLYQLLAPNYPLFNGERWNGLACIETFPHAIVCALTSRVESAKPKGTVSRKALRERGFDLASLTNIDFVDAALCAVAANEFRKGNYHSFGNREEGFIVVPLRDEL